MLRVVLSYLEGLFLVYVVNVRYPFRIVFTNID